MGDKQQQEPQRWTTKRKTAILPSIVEGETSAVEAARKHGLTIAELETWKDRFLLGAENALRSKSRNEEALKDEEINRLKRKIGDLVMDEYSGEFCRVFRGKVATLAVVRASLQMIIRGWQNCRQSSSFVRYASVR